MTSKVSHWLLAFGAVLALASVPSCADEGDDPSDTSHDTGTDTSDGSGDVDDEDTSPDTASDVETIDDTADDGSPSETGGDVDDTADEGGDLEDSDADETGDVETGDVETGDVDPDTDTGEHCPSVHGPHWTYEGEHGEEHWGSLGAEYEACDLGSRQSPIDLPYAIAPSRHPEMHLDYHAGDMQIVNNGHTVQVNVPAGSTMTIGDDTYALVQFHYHVQSEHTIDEEHYPLEIHFVHQNADCELAVVGALFNEGESNPALETYAANLPPTESEGSLNIDPGALLPAELASWRYSGSLTTPPCAEGVEWFVLSEISEASATQLEAFTSLFGHENRRSVQERHERVIEGPHWGYHGDVGPDRWADLSPRYEICAEGERQSPIDIPAAAVAPVPRTDLTFNYAPGAVRIHNNGHTVQVDFVEGHNTLTIDSVDYTLVQFHFHTQSEHEFDGVHFPLEAHLVHSDDDGNLAVVGVVFEVDASHTVLAALSSHLPAEHSEPELIDGLALDPTALLPSEDSRTGWRYSGSLTTPGCSEGVHWTVMSEPQSASEGEIDDLAAILNNNWRPVADLNDRSID